MGTDDPRNRPIVLQTGPPGEGPGPRRRPRSRTLLGGSAAAVLTAAILVAGSWSVWAVVGTTAPHGKPAAPLWFSPPAPETSTEDTWAPEFATGPSTEDTPERRPATEHEAEDRHPRETGSAPTTTQTRSGPSSDDQHHGKGRGGRG